MNTRALRTRASRALAILTASPGQRSKLGTHNNHFTNGPRVVEFCKKAHPRAMMVLHHDTNILTQIRKASPETKLILRYYVDESDQMKRLMSNPEDAARWFFMDHVLNREPSKYYDYVVGFNEPARNDKEVWRHMGRYDGAMADLCHVYGTKYLAGSFGVGHPTVLDWVTLPEVRAGWAKADGIANHEYSANQILDPRGMDAERPGEGWLTLRYRKWYPLLAPECRKPVFITECGIDSGAALWDPGAQGGWKSFCNAEQYMSQLAAWDQELRKDSFVEGCCIFCRGTLDPTWDSFDITGRVEDLLQNYLIDEYQPTEEKEFKYHSHVVLVPQELPQEGWDAIRRYVDEFRVTLSRSEHDAVSMRGGLSHTVTAIEPTDDRVRFLSLENAREPFVIDVLRRGSWTLIRQALDWRADNGIRVVPTLEPH